MSETIVVVGAGHAAGQLVTSLRQLGFEGKIQLVGEEKYIPYQRPPLSKAFLAGEIGIDRVEFKPQQFYDDQNVELILGVQVERIDREGQTVHLSDGRTLSYDKLALTTGARVRKIKSPGSDLDGIFYLRNVDDVESIQSHFKKGGKLAVIGAGYIGLEVAAVARKHGIDVTVVEMADRVLARVAPPVLSEFFDRLHTDEGVNVLTNVTTEGFEGENGQVSGVKCADGSVIPADFVVIGIGILPNVELAEACGLDVNNGIVVDEYAQTSDPKIVSAGDCTWHPNGLMGISLRLESVHNALEQAKTAAATLIGKQLEYNQIPWNWSDQYDVKLQIAGLNTGHDQVVVRGNPDERHFAVFYLKEGQLIAVDAVNAPKEFMMSRRVLPNKPHPDTNKLVDVSLDVKEIFD